ncbi:MAG: prepilin-type N-terminal cleavage/methylation domain-containing protein [Gemmataceae bacterium]|nr:prepilin-type N-terminal cleavage/methylation domain-containing protein [Gemmataceae bacterium]
MNRILRHRRGFTLVELLVVIAILAVLVGLTGAGIFQWINSQKRRNSENTLRTVYQTLKSHWSEVVSEARKEPIPTEVMNFAGNDPDRARVIWIKTRLIEAFPVRYAEVQVADPYLSYPLRFIPPGKRRYMLSYQAALSGKTSPNDPAIESSVLLLKSLGMKRGSGPLNADDLGTATQIKTSDGVRAIVDGWSNSVYFVRFATSNAALNAANPTPNVDPLDPKGTILSSSWSGQPDATVMPSSTKLARITAWYHAPNGATQAWYTIPVIASAGQDGQLGLNSAAAPFDNLGISNAGQEADNLYSYKLGGTP